MNFQRSFEKAEPLPGFPDKLVRVTKKNQVIKQHPTPQKARQEFLAACFARMLLPLEMRPYRRVKLRGKFFVTNRIPGTYMDKNDQAAVVWASCYLSKMHAIPVGYKERMLLKQHYAGKALLKRLVQDIDYAVRAFGIRKTRGMSDLVDEVLKRITVYRDIVVSHGDFQVSNIIVTTSGVHPVDWVDFGLGLRSYEVAHFLATVPEELHQRAMEAYYANAPKLSANDLAIGRAVNAIIRVGSFGRVVESGAHPPSFFQNRFSECMSAFMQAMADLEPD